MRIEEVQGLCARMTHTPGTHIEVRVPERHDPMFGWAVIHVAVPCVDAESDVGVVPIARDLYVSDVELGRMEPWMLVKRVKHYLYALAQHEVDEFFKIDGRLVTEPHPEYHGDDRCCVVKAL